MASAAAIAPVSDPIADEIVEGIFETTRLGRDPSPFYHRLRARHRAYFAAGRNMWILTGHAEVEQVLRSPAAQLQLATRMATVRPDWRDHPASANLEGVIAFVDGPPHQKIRKALFPHWTRPQMERFRPHVRAQAKQLVDRFVANGGGSFAKDVAYPMAEGTLYRLFDMDADTPRNLPELVETIQFAFELDVTDAQLAAADQAAVEMRAFWQEEYLKRVRNPGEDMLSALATDPSFSVEEGTKIAESLYGGGFDSTALTMTTGMWLLTEHPDVVARLRSDPAARERLPDEVLRMGGAIPMTIRVATEDIPLGDQTIRTGQLIGVGLLAANRDPAVFPDPDQFDLDRPAGRVMSFSSGVHTCLGHWLARMELLELYGALLDATTHIERVGEARFRLRQSVRGIEVLDLAVR